LQTQSTLRKKPVEEKRQRRTVLSSAVGGGVGLFGKGKPKVGRRRYAALDHGVISFESRGGVSPSGTTGIPQWG